ncbi:Psrc1 isoform A [Columba livia]|nr:Psrc1 isoform A [Columba livia]
MAEEQDVRFVTEESFDFSFVSPSDSREEEDEDEDEDKDIPGGASGRWSPLSGARLEEMVREATRLAAQLEQCHLPPRGTPPTPRSPRRQTFVVKDSPVRALLPTVESPPHRHPAPPPPNPGVPLLPPMSPAPGRSPLAVTPQRCRRDPPGPGCPPLAGWAPPGLALPRDRGLGHGARPSPPGLGQQVPALRGGQGQGRGQPGGQKPPPRPTMGWGGQGTPASPPPPLSPQARQRRGGAQPLPPPATRQSRTRATTVPVPSGHPPRAQCHPQDSRPDPSGGSSTGREGICAQRCGGGAGGPSSHWLGVQTRAPLQSPAPPPGRQQ